MNKIQRARRKLKILKRDGFSCVNCGRKDNFTIDHIDFGKIKFRNASAYVPERCVTLCCFCHEKKNHKNKFVIKKCEDYLDKINQNI